MASGRVLITGGSGLLALNWACAMRREWDVVLGTHAHTVRLEGVSARPLDLDDGKILARQFKEIAPDLVVHAAGLTSVDQCEENPDLARHVNAGLARNVAEAAATGNIRLVHISTDHLFAGTRSGYREEDAPEPLNEYARSKLLAEEWVGQANLRALIIRTNFFGWGHAGRQSFSDWIIYSLRAGREITLFDDVFFTPILADALAKAAHRLVGLAASGTFNVAGDERVSKYEFAKRLAQAFDLPGELIQRGRIRDAGLFAKRPPDMSMDNTKASDLLSASLGRLDDYIRILRRQESESRREELFHAVTE
ncbi:MAG: NAD(P)-dependent oxidoreductase [Planctomycetota bacterium]|nr:SDR family oxidoreductase [Rhodocyclaceae bacterium]MCZ2116067.1 SDR family oxidoreductase [Anaerolineae bacterium]GIK54242.1 MAG: NAD(P)-dependent oxidoreductase [Planctomycetota bacterium]